MAIKTKEELKSVFETGDKPTQQDFIDLIDSATGSASLLVAETEVTGSAVTSITFSGLDGNAHGGYVLVCDVVVATGQPNLAFVTNDATTKKSVFSYIVNSATNFRTDADKDVCWISIANTSSILCTTAIGVVHNSAVTVSSLSSGRLNVDSSLPASCMISGFVSGASLTNITSITITSSVASAIDIGSTFRLYRRK